MSEYNSMVSETAQVVQVNLPATYPTSGTGHNPESRSQESPGKGNTGSRISHSDRAQAKTMEKSTEQRGSFRTDTASADDNTK
jgi:hypothetical protein